MDAAGPVLWRRTGQGELGREIAGRLDTAAVRADLGDAYSRFEKAIVSTVVRIKAVDRLAIAA